jgi:hypothetical protein
MIKKGDLITCTNGHVIGEALRDVALGDEEWGNAFGNWRQVDVPGVGSIHKPPCATCGAPFIHPDCWSMHFTDGWKPPQWDGVDATAPVKR